MKDVEKLKKLVEDLKTVSELPTLQGLFCKQTFYPENFTKEDGEKLEKLIEKEQKLYEEKTREVCYLKTRIITGQESVVRNYGLDVWCWLCDNVRVERTFSYTFVSDNCPHLQHLAPRTRKDYVKVILKNVLAEYEEKTEEELFGLKCPIKQVSLQRFVLVGSSEEEE